MLMKVVVENGVKKLVPLTADAGSGNPCGTIIAVYSNQVPYGYLPCNGVAFDTAQFPVLYALLGDNHTPDLRECTLKGIGESGRTVGAHVKAGGLAVGEFIDDRVQTNAGDTPIVIKADQYSLGEGSVKITAGDNIPAGSAQTTIRGGATTEVKAVGVNFCIKATSGINENQADNVLSALTPVDQVALNNLHSVTSNAVYPIKEKADKLYDTNLLNQVRSLPLVRWEELPSQSINDSIFFQEWYDYMIDHGYFGSGTESYIGLAIPNYLCSVWGFTYEGVDVKNYSSFVALKPTGIVRFGYDGGQWYFTGIH